MSTTTHQQTLPVCAVPGCHDLVAAWGEVCTGCRQAFGDYLEPVDRPPMTEEQLAARDTGVRLVLAERYELTPAPVEALPVERRRGQLCWLCEQHRTCTRRPHGWECDACRAVA